MHGKTTIKIKAYNSFSRTLIILITHRMGLNSQHGKTYFSPQHPHWIWEPASLLSNVVGALSPGMHWPGHVGDSLCPSSAEIIEVISSFPTHLHGVMP
jgi:hypothetical protein